MISKENFPPLATLTIFSSNKISRSHSNLSRPTGNTDKSESSRKKGSLHDHLSPGKQRVADELARPQGNGSVGHGCRFLIDSEKSASTSDERKREVVGGRGGLSKFAVDFSASRIAIERIFVVQCPGCGLG